MDINVQNTYEGPEFKSGWFDIEQLDPSENKECCTALGGNVITKTEWKKIYDEKNDINIELTNIINSNYTSYKQNKKTLEQSYNDTIIELTKDSRYDGSLTFDSYQKIGEYTYKYYELNGRNGWRDQYKLISCNFDFTDTCVLTEINWDEVISTNSVCSINSPVSCDLYGLLQVRYWLTIGQMQQQYDTLKDCIDNKNNLINNITTAQTQYNLVLREKGLLQEEYINKLNLYNQQKEICSNDIVKLQDEITFLELEYESNKCNNSTGVNTTGSSSIKPTFNFDDGFNLDDLETVVNFGKTDPCASATPGCPYAFARTADGTLSILYSVSNNECGCKGDIDYSDPNRLPVVDLGLCKGDSNYCSCCKVSDIVEDYYVANTGTTTDNVTDPTYCNKLLNDLNNKNVELNEKISNCKKIDDDFNLVTEEYESKLQILNDKLFELSNLIDNYNQQLNTNFNCCDDQLELLKKLIDESIKDKETVKKYANECLDAWHNERMVSYAEYLSKNNTGNSIFDLINENKVYLTLEVVDKTNDTSISNTTTILNVDNNNLKEESYWVFSGTNEYTGVVIEGESEESINLVKKSLINDIKNKYGTQYGGVNTFEPKWQHLRLPISSDLVNLYKNREFKFGIVVDNYGCNVCLKIDSIQINRNCNDLKNFSNTEICPTFDLKCIKDNKRSWVYKNDGIQIYKNDNTLETSINVIDTENRIWTDLEYRYTDYNVNNDDLIINSKSTIFRIDPAKAIECDIYNYFKSVTACTYSGYVCENSFIEVTCGSETITECVCNDTLVNIDPLNYLDTPISEMITKESIDDMILSNLIDAKSRQVINGYPLLELLVWLYMNPDNCGGVSGQLNYSSMFQFMDLVGDYWMDLIEQIVPATTIWDGCENSGKIYRNIIFDRDKYSYKRYVLESEYLDGTCTIEKTTNDVVGFTEVYFETETICSTKNGGVCNGVDEYYMDNNGVVHKIEKEIKLNNTYSNIVYIKYINDSNEYESTNIDSSDTITEENILFERNCSPPIDCDDQKQFEDGVYFEFMDDEPYYFMS